MAVMLDIIASFVLGALLSLNVGRMSENVSARFYWSSLAYLAQSSATTVAAVMSEDLRKVGVRVPGTAITIADTSRIRFLGDLGGDGIVDTLYYFVGNVGDAGDTPNPADRPVFRALNGGPPQAMSVGVTRLRLSYFDAEGDSLSQPVPMADVRRIRVDLTVESTVPYDTAYAKTLLRFSVRPRCLGL